MSERRKSPIKIEETQPQMCSVDLRLEILDQVPFFSQLTGNQIEEINRSFHEYGYQAGETIYFAGDPAARLYVVAAGKVKLMRHTSRGKDVLLDILTPGEFFGSLSYPRDERYPDTAQAQTSVCVLAIDAENFHQILKTHTEVTLQVLNVMAERLREAYEMVRQLSAHSVERRIAYTLLKLAEKLGEESDVGLLIQAPLSRDDLAEMTGTSTETASRIVSQFQKDGLVETGRQWVSIADRAGLQKVIDEAPD